VKEPADFSLVLGGPLYQLWRRTRLAGDSLQFPNRRVITLALLAWLPLLLLSMAQGLAWGDRVAVPCHSRGLARVMVLEPANRSTMLSVMYHPAPNCQRLAPTSVVVPASGPLTVL